MQHYLASITITLTALLGGLMPASGQQEITLIAAPGTVEIAPGVTVNAWMYNGQLPGPTIRGTEGETVKIRFVNQLPAPTTVHWHGLPVPNGMDGVPGVSRPPIQPGQEFTYEFTLTHPGTYFYHPHVGHQLDRGLHGAIIVDPAGPGDPAFDSEIVIDVDDWLPGAPVPLTNPIYSDWLINGRTSAGQPVHTIQPGDAVRVRFINSSSATNYVVTIDGHPMTVTHSDGRRVQPLVVDSIPIGAGERYDVIIDATNPGTWSIAAAEYLSPTTVRARAILAYSGSTVVPPPAAYAPPGLTNGIRLNYTMLSSAEPVTPLPSTADRSMSLALSGDMVTYTWTMGGQSWPTASTLQVIYGEEVRVSMYNTTIMAHPMHLHGHFFRLHGTAGGTTNPPLKDTVLIESPLAGAGVPTSATFDMFADNPGRWMFHCHNIYHAHAGMMRILEYTGGDQDGDGVDDSRDYDATIPYPVLNIDGLGGGFLPGSSVSFDVQWPAGTWAYVWVGNELGAPVGFGNLGSVLIDTPLFVGTGLAGASDVASVVAAIPAVPSLTGLRVAAQAAATTALAPGVRLSTVAILTVN